MADESGEPTEPAPESGTAGDVTVADGGDAVTVQLPEGLGDWLDEQVADDPDHDRADVLRDLAAAYRELEAGGDGPARADLVERLDAQREEYVDLVEDVRERMVDLRRELDERASEDHEHEHETDVDLESVAPDLPDRLDRIESDLAALEDHVDSGFDNYESILEELTGAVDEMGGRVDTLAARVVGDDDGADGDLDRLKRAANQIGTREATCEDCGNSIDIGLLTAPECPRCESPFSDLHDDGGLFGSPTLAVGDPPALKRAASDGGESE